MIGIDRYECRKVNRQDVWYAIKGKKEFVMPSCYSEMYDDEHLAIREVTLTMPELYGDDVPPTHYQPLRTPE